MNIRNAKILKWKLNLKRFFTITVFYDGVSIEIADPFVVHPQHFNALVPTNLIKDK
jgi:hypothetical protein